MMPYPTGCRTQVAVIRDALILFTTPAAGRPLASMILSNVRELYTEIIQARQAAENWSL